MEIKRFLLHSKNINHDSYVWNMTGSLLVAFQSVIMLLILTRVLGLSESGVLTIAYANAILFMTIGKYGMRNFQVSDVQEQFTFNEYWISRIVTCGIMMVFSIIYVLIAHRLNNYTIEKSMVIIWMCLLKMIDAMEDIFHGLYQQKNRLDVAGKALTLRMFLTIVIFAFSVVLIRDLLCALIISTISSITLFILFTRWTYDDFKVQTRNVKKENVILLLKLCLPLFVGTFLSIYIGNAPKYAIDATLTDELQACYGFIAMPVFVISLLSGFIFNPVLHKMSVLWCERNIKEFVIRTVEQVGIIFIITFMCIVGAYFLGVPVLSWLYATDLAPYKIELLILLLGGGFLGLASFLNIVNTIIRQQKKVMWGYVVISAIAFLFSNKVVGQFGMSGAAVLYTVLMGILCIIFGGILAYCVVEEKQQS